MGGRLVLSSFEHMGGGSFWDRFGIVLESFWGRRAIVVGSFWNRFGVVIGSCWDRFWVHFGFGLGSFWDCWEWSRCGVVLDSF